MGKDIHQVSNFLRMCQLYKQAGNSVVVPVINRVEKQPCKAIVSQKGMK